MRNRVIPYTLALVLLLVAGQACASKGGQPTPTPSSGEVSLVVLDRGFLSCDQGVCYEKHSQEAKLYRFNSKLGLATNLLTQQNPAHRWGFNASLYPARGGKEFLLVSPMLRVNLKNNPAATTFMNKGRVSRLDAQTLELISSADFVSYAYEEGVRSFPNEAFALSETEIYLIHREARTTYKVELNGAETKRTEVGALKGYNLRDVHLHNGTVYALEQTSPENYHLLAYHPTTGKAELIEVQKPSKVMNWQEELLYLGYANGAVAIYNLDSRTFVLQPTLLHPDLGAVWNATLDKSTSTLYLAFSEAHVRPYLYYIKLSEVQHNAMPTRFAKLDMTTSDGNSGKTRLYFNAHTQQLVVLYFHSQRQYQGGRANIYNTKDIPTLAGQLAKPLREFRLQQELSTPVQAYFIQ